MANYFLKVDKDLFKLGLNPTEILLLAQMIEFQTNTGDCFISDSTLAENFGVSESTVKREIKNLEELGYIKRDTKNIKGGKERHITVDIEKLTKLNLTLVEPNKAQNEPCTKLNLTLDKEQIDTIKDKRKDNIGKEKGRVDKTVSLRSTVVINSQESQKPVDELTEKEKKERFNKAFGY